MPSPIKTPACYAVFSDITLIWIQRGKPVAVSIANQDIADSFAAYFEVFWSQSKRVK